MKKISIAIPTYEMGGRGREALEFSFEKIATQSFKNFDVVISDHSKDNAIKDLCDQWQDKINIKYFRNENNRGSASKNTENAIRKSTGEFVKILCQDDWLYNKYSLEKIADVLNNKVVWLASSYVHSNDKINYFKRHYPTMNDNIFIVNTIGTPSCLTIKNLKDLPGFDENLTYCYDCEWYYRLLKAYGDPVILNEITMVNYLWDNSVTSKITPELINKENQYILEKFGLHQNNPFNSVTRLS